MPESGHAAEHFAESGPGMDKKACTRLFTRLKRSMPAPTTELEYDSEFELLVAVMLSAQATDISVK